VLSYDDVMGRLDPMMDWLAKTYVNALNIIHYMHDKYCYEAIEMALHDRDILRTMACGIAGLSHATDSLSAIKYAKGSRSAMSAESSSTSRPKASSRASATTTIARTTSPRRWCR
jgi:pyruvate-formate lyase